MALMTSSPPSRVGRPALIRRLTRRDIIPITLDLIYGAWPQACSHPLINPASSEPEMAGALFQALWKLKKERGIEGPPHIICEAASRSDESLLIPDGRIDFKLIYDYDREAYFSIECKRISATDGTLANLYITQGIVRFTSGKYAGGHDWAAMLAFVIDKNPTGAAKLVNTRIEEFPTETYLVGTVIVETAFGSRSHLYRSNHRPSHSRNGLNILHLYVSV